MQTIVSWQSLQDWYSVVESNADSKKKIGQRTTDMGWGNHAAASPPIFCFLVARYLLRRVQLRQHRNIGEAHRIGEEALLRAFIEEVNRRAAIRRRRTFRGHDAVLVHRAENLCNRPLRQVHALELRQE